MEGDGPPGLVLALLQHGVHRGRRSRLGYGRGAHPPGHFLQVLWGAGVETGNGVGAKGVSAVVEVGGDLERCYRSERTANSLCGKACLRTTIWVSETPQKVSSA